MRPKPGVADDSCLLEPACGSGHFLVQVLCLDLAAGMRSRCALMMASPSALQIANGDHAAWYRELFGPSVTAGTVQAPCSSRPRGLPQGSGVYPSFQAHAAKCRCGPRSHARVLRISAEGIATRRAGCAWAFLLRLYTPICGGKPADIRRPLLSWSAARTTWQRWRARVWKGISRHSRISLLG